MSATASDYPGERLGRPVSGRGSIGRPGRRIGALFIDYAAATILATAFLGYDQFALPEQAGWTLFSPMIVFAALQILFIPTLGGSPGHRIVGMRVERVTGGWAGLWRPVVRTALLVVVLPAVIWDADQRGLHDKVSGLILVRS
ncbi:RDD family protein [Microbacterium sp. EYE_5]|uniref:RDD family protein n=1 Tax=unclassified Microbacterium TaxID=2609290 RepID=UPI002003EF6A|nr:MULTISPECIES: RDD family protein [unclassified Microbacterium]MCK6080653.1 RDD family protein [Microbacterium sp. EYE_382]MCK6085924.1 RDD family protein [Microbacterium sp. EYE_384]MCK6124578.1 RDD family protein [Microbacterium sp. EYE_80]MCK6127487.1 RDD family protein [Microbacterium sp. EYE_79]MCK6141608.1 RDD family protein [Microbacterium sp. EYE_39]